MQELIFAQAKVCFGPKVYAFWPGVIREAEYALWVVWNERFGPLTSHQREYAVRLIVRALIKAQAAPNPIAAYYTYLRAFYTHEDVCRKMKEYGDSVAMVSDNILGGFPE